MARFGTKRYSHTHQDLIVNSKEDNRIHLSSGEDGTTGVVVVGISGYKNEEQLRGGNHWAKIYSSKCLSGDVACERAPRDAKFGALMCDFNDFEANAEIECWTITTVGRAPNNCLLTSLFWVKPMSAPLYQSTSCVTTRQPVMSWTLVGGKNATTRQKRRSYRNPVDRFFLVAGARGRTAAQGGSNNDRTKVFINDVTDDDEAKGEGRGLVRRNPNRRSLKRPACTDVLPPPSDGKYYSCAQQKEWGKCDWWFIINGGYCEKTCGRCVEIFEPLTDDYDDYDELDVAPSVAPAEAPSDAPANAPASSAASADLVDDMQPMVESRPTPAVVIEEEEPNEEEAEKASPGVAPAPTPEDAADEDVLDATAPSTAGGASDDKDLMADADVLNEVDFDKMADDVLARATEEV